MKRAQKNCLLPEVVAENGDEEGSREKTGIRGGNAPSEISGMTDIPLRAQMRCMFGLV
jgi:hypothetical protein